MLLKPNRDGGMPGTVPNVNTSPLIHIDKGTFVPLLVVSIITHQFLKEFTLKTTGLQLQKDKKCIKQ